MKWNIKVFNLNNFIDAIKIELLEPISPEDLKKIVEDVKKEWRKLENIGDVIIISGKAPIWLYSTICHEFNHIYKDVCIFDPKLKAAVITTTHKNNDIGKVLILNNEEIKKLL